MTSNHTPFNVDKVKEWNVQNPTYSATHYLCLVPSQQITSFASSYMEVTGRDETLESWNVYDTKQNGYKISTERYAIPNGPAYDPALF